MKWWIGGFFTLLIVLFTFVVGRTQKSGGACYEQQAAQNQENPVPFVTKEQERPQQTNGPTPNSESYLCRLITPANLPTDYLVIVGIGGVFVAIFTLKSIEKSAEAAFLNAQVLIDTERAFIDARIVAPISHIDPENGQEIMGISADTSLFRFGVQLTNHGKTVARVLNCWISHKYLTKPLNALREIEFDNLTEIASHSLLGADKSRVVAHVDIDTLFADSEAIMEQTKIGVFRIDVEYRDIVEKTKSRRTSVYFEWIADKEEPGSLPEYDIYT